MNQSLIWIKPIRDIREIWGTNKPFSQCSFDEDDKAVEFKSIEQAKQYLSPNIYTANKFGHCVDLARY